MALPKRHQRIAFVIASYITGAAHFAYKAHLLPEGIGAMKGGFIATVIAVWLVSPIWVLPALIAVPIYLLIHSQSPFDRELVVGWPLFAGVLVLTSLLLARSSKRRSNVG